MSETPDIIVVGAGPAGSSCARRAAELGLSVRAVEKSFFPRPKPCGGGLTDKALRLLGGDQRPVEQRRFNTAEIAFGHHLSFIISGRDALVATTARADLDQSLVRSAEAAGAVFEFGRTVDGLGESDDEVRVTIGSDVLRACRVVFADGARGPGRRLLGLDPVGMGGGLYVRAYTGSGELPADLTDRVLFDPTATERGYAWVFPKGDHLNVGVYSQRSLEDGYVRDLNSFIAQMGLSDWRTEGPYAFPIPVDRPPDALGTERVLFAGDAAGLANPVTGEGISSAVLSGRLAAEAIAESIDSGRPASVVYSGRVHREVLPMTDGSRRKAESVYGMGPGVLKFLARTPVLSALMGPAWRAATRKTNSLTLSVVRDRGGVRRRC